MSRPYFCDEHVTLHLGDSLSVLSSLDSGSVDCCVTSPPYFGLRDYGVEGQYGLEAAPAAYVETMRAVFAEVRRVLADDGTLWLNIGASYASSGGMSGVGPNAQVGSTLRQAQGRTRPSLSGFAAPRGAPCGDTSCTGRSDCQDSGCACSCLCGGCADAQSSRSARTPQPQPESLPRHEQIARGKQRPGSAEASATAALPCAQESTTPLSSALPRAECSHCANCGVCLAVLGSSSRDASLCARRESYTNGTSPHESGVRNRGTDALGTAWLNYSAALGPKSLIQIPAMVSMALQMDGWTLRNDLIWAKPNGMPESVTDRLSTKHEHVFMFSKSPRYFFDLDGIREEHTSDLPAGYTRTSGEWVKTTENNHNRTGVQGLHLNGKNPGDVWSIATSPFPESHFACMPTALAERCILAGCKPAGTVLDPFSGSGTTGLAATKHGRRYVGIDLSAEYLDLSLRTRLVQATLDFGSTA